MKHLTEIVHVIIEDTHKDHKDVKGGVLACCAKARSAGLQSVIHHVLTDINVMLRYVHVAHLP